MQSRTKTTAVGLAGMFVGTMIGLAALTSAQPTYQAAAPPPHVIGIATHARYDGSGSMVFRVWNDGLIEQNWQVCVGCGWAGWVVVPEN